VREQSAAPPTSTPLACSSLSCSPASHLADTHVADALIADASGDFAYAARALRRALAREPLHAYAHETLGCLELEAGVATDQRLRIAWALDPHHLGALVHAARDLAMSGRITEAIALLGDVDRSAAQQGQPPVIEAALMRARLAAWTRDAALARATLVRVADVEHVAVGAIMMIARGVTGDCTHEELRAFLDQLLALPTSPKRRGFILQVYVELIARSDPEAAAGHLLSAAQLPLADLRWLDACPALDDLREHPSFRIARAIVDVRVRDAFGDARRSEKNDDDADATEQGIPTARARP